MPQDAPCSIGISSMIYVSSPSEMANGTAPDRSLPESQWDNFTEGSFDDAAAAASRAYVQRLEARLAGIHRPPPSALALLTDPEKSAGMRALAKELEGTRVTSSTDERGTSGQAPPPALDDDNAPLMESILVDDGVLDGVARTISRDSTSVQLRGLPPPGWIALLCSAAAAVAAMIGALLRQCRQLISASLRRGEEVLP